MFLKRTMTSTDISFKYERRLFFAFLVLLVVFLVEVCRQILQVSCVCRDLKKVAEHCLRPSAHSRFLSLRHTIFVFNLKNLLYAVS